MITFLEYHFEVNKNFGDFFFNSVCVFLEAPDREA